MQKLQAGDDSAFQKIMVKYQKPILNYVYRWLHNAGEAEEIAQEVFLRVYKARSTFQPSARLSPWLYTIATNLCLIELRRRKRRPWFWQATSRHQDEMQNPSQEIADPRSSVLDNLRADEKEKTLVSAIEGLPRKEKTALLLRKYQELSYREIAKIMDCGEGAVKTLIHRGKLRLRERLQPYLRQAE